MNETKQNATRETPYPGCSPNKLCVHGNPWGGPCLYCDGRNNPKPMNETKHTPGPWTIRDRTGTVGNPAMGIEGPQGEVVARVIYQDGFGALQANARLIAAAPELLEALQKINDWTLAPGSQPDPAQVAKIARAAIAKAGGAA